MEHRVESSFFRLRVTMIFDIPGGIESEETVELRNVPFIGTVDDVGVANAYSPMNKKDIRWMIFKNTRMSPSLRHDFRTRLNDAISAEFSDGFEDFIGPETVCGGPDDYDAVVDDRMTGHRQH